METKMSQMRVKPRAIIAEGCGGTIFWATPTRARMLIDANAAELVNAGPLERPAIGPIETKPAGPAEKKSLAADPDGRSIDSASSAEPGPAALSSASAEALVSPERIAPRLRPRASGRTRKS